MAVCVGRKNETTENRCVAGLARIDVDARVAWRACPAGTRSIDTGIDSRSQYLSRKPGNPTATRRAGSTVPATAGAAISTAAESTRTTAGGSGAIRSLRARDLGEAPAGPLRSQRVAGPLDYACRGHGGSQGFSAG